MIELLKNTFWDYKCMRAAKKYKDQDPTYYNWYRHLFLFNLTDIKYRILFWKKHPNTIDFE